MATIAADGFVTDKLAHLAFDTNFGSITEEQTLTDYEDFTTRAFYRITIDTEGESKLIIRRKADEDDGYNNNITT